MNLSQYVAYPQRRLALQAVIGGVVAKTANRVLRKRLPPGVSEFGALAKGVYADSATLLAGVSWSTPDLRDGPLRSLVAEHTRLRAELLERYQRRQLAFPAAWAVESETSLLLYALVRGLRPSEVIEMGVGNGQSSYYIVRALRANGTGTLHSFDVLPQAGGLLSQEERAVWDFRLIDRWRAGKSLTAQLATLPRAGLCFHDAGHGYLSQFYEYGCLWEQLVDSGILISDDVDLSYGFIDFCRLDGKQADILIDRRKAVGVLQRIRHAPSAEDRQVLPAQSTPKRTSPEASSQEPD